MNGPLPNNLTSLARHDTPPLIDVAAAVMRRLRSRAAAVPSNALIWFFTAGSSALAAAVVMLAMRIVTERQDVFGAFLQSITAQL